MGNKTDQIVKETANVKKAVSFRIVEEYNKKSPVAINIKSYFAK
ncbi:hypothetical protein [Cytobacillus sp.]|nr:hypothetical protein [Cytobacillus sp.]